MNALTHIISETTLTEDENVWMARAIQAARRNRELLETCEKEGVQPLPTMRSIIAEVAYKYALTSRDITGRGRTDDITRARQEAMYHLVSAKRWSLPQIGRAIGRHHTTAWHGAKVHEKRMGQGA